MAFSIFFSFVFVFFTLPSFLFHLGLIDATQFDGLICCQNSRSASAMATQEMPDFIGRSRQVQEVTPSSVETDMAALLAFKDEISVDPLGVLVSWGRTNLTSPCSGWMGVRCSDGLRVSSLNLTNKSLSGPISPQLQFLDHLTYLNLSINNFSGRIPPKLGLLAPTLTHLDLHQNSLVGPIPVEIGLCKQLLWLDLSKNGITGSIPASFVNLASLRILMLHNMPNLTGNIPPQLGSLGNLTNLYLAQNNLMGDIPPELGNLEKLEQITLFMNNLTGPIPPQLGRLQNLKGLIIFQNKFMTGGIPPELGQLSNLTDFYASSCNLSGSLPRHLGNLTNLEHLSLSDNALTGSIPPEFGRLKNLQELNMYSNRLSGPLPPQLGQLKKLKSIYLFSNELSGPIPLEFGQMQSLQVLHIYHNSINGSLPAELGGLQNLKDFYAFSNQLTGPIPAEFGHMKSLINVNLADNQLTGNIPLELGMLKNLQYLDISDSTLRGEIPSTLANLTDLWYLDVSFNSITGQLPDFLANFTLLEWIKISDNRLSGKVGSELSSLSKLRFVSLSNNSLTGSIPASFANHSSLVALDLSRNQFTGSLPDSLGLCENLRVLLVGHNKLGGPLPSWLWRLGQLQVLDLSDNDFTGSIPDSLEKLHGLQALAGQTPDLNTAKITINTKGTQREYFNVLQYTTSLDVSVNRIGGNLPETLGLLKVLFSLNMSWNSFSGAIPGSMSNMSTLESLDLSHNKLTGRIPSDFARLSALSNVDFSSNNLSGSIPQGPQFSSFNSQRFLDNPYLCGLPLNNSCSDGQPEIEKETILAQRGLSTNSKIAIAVSFSVVIITLGVMALSCVQRIKYDQKPQRNNHEQSLFGNELNITVQDLIVATGDYNDSNIIGKGGSSTVYKAVLTNEDVVAVKKLHTLNEEAAWRSLVAECKTLGKMRHRNLVKILCTCVTAHLKAIVLDYMPNGSLHTILYECKLEAFRLSWEARFKIACGIAEGLKYLHYDSGFGQVLHLDLKPGNILLDKDFEPHISDFGISRLVNADKDGSTLASAFAGSVGYMPPEMGYSNRVTSQADVYSYGVIILELITRKRPIDTPSDWTDYPGWIHSFLPHKTREVIDPQLLHDDEIIREKGYQEICSVLKLGLMCAQVLPSSRPTMRDVVKELLSIAGNDHPACPYVASHTDNVFGFDQAASRNQFLVPMTEMSSVSTSLFSTSNQEITEHSEIPMTEMSSVSTSLFSASNQEITEHSEIPMTEMSSVSTSLFSASNQEITEHSEIPMTEMSSVSTSLFSASNQEITKHSETLI